jgi:ABC-type amino acid transport substrate-binding protein
MITKRIIGTLAFTVAVIGALVAHAQQSTDPRVADLVQSGKLRVGIGLGSPVLAMKDPNTGEVRGPALDLARALAKKIGLSSNQSNIQDRAQSWRALRTMSGT